MLLGLVGERDRTAEPALVGDGAAHQLAHRRLVGGCRVSSTPGQQWRDDREVRVLGGRREQRHRTVLDRGEQRVLLGLAEAVHLVDEEHGRRAARAALTAGRVDHRPDVLDAGGQCRHRHEPPVGGARHQVRDGGLAAAGWPPQDHRHGGGTGDQLAQRCARGEQVLLADQLIQGDRAHPYGQRRRRVRGVGQRAALTAGAGRRSSGEVERAPPLTRSLRWPSARPRPSTPRRSGTPRGGRPPGRAVLSAAARPGCRPREPSSTACGSGSQRAGWPETARHPRSCSRSRVPRASGSGTGTAESSARV